MILLTKFENISWLESSINQLLPGMWTGVYSQPLDSGPAPIKKKKPVIDFIATPSIHCWKSHTSYFIRPHRTSILAYYHIREARVHKRQIQFAYHNRTGQYQSVEQAVPAHISTFFSLIMLHLLLLLAPLVAGGSDHIDPECHMNPMQIGNYYGYAMEEYYPVTEDGYILAIHRVVPKKSPSPVVFLQHGLLDSSATWVLNGKKGGWI